jgi:cytochrome c
MTRCVVLGLLLLGTSAGAQTAKRSTPQASDSVPANGGPSTWTGVYTVEQAARGKDVYAGNCRSCHTPAAHTGEMFATWWRGKRLSDLFMFVSTQMPKNDPGSLAPEDAADVVAYLLQINAMPPGKVELYPDVDSLRKFRIEIRRHDSTTARRSP